MIVLYFNNEDVERGPGLWILNNELLYDGIYKEKIMQLIQKEKICMLYNTFFYYGGLILSTKLRNF